MEALDILYTRYGNELLFSNVDPNNIETDAKSIGVILRAC